MLFFVASSSCFAQKDNGKLELLIQTNRYGENTIAGISKNVKVNNYFFIGKYYIDRYNKGIIDYTTLETGLDRLIPKESDGFLILDIENKIYHALKKGEVSGASFKSNAKKFVDMIKFVKEKRPNLKVSVYGIPFTRYWDPQQFGRYDEIVKQMDFISPHLYIYYPDEQFGQDKNEKYLKDNLAVFMDYKRRLNVDVYPFIWYVIHPSNKKYGGKFIETKRMKKYIKIIDEYEYEGQNVNGAIWWEPGRSKKQIQATKENNTESSDYLAPVDVILFDVFGSEK